MKTPGKTSQRYRLQMKVSNVHTFEKGFGMKTTPDLDFLVASIYLDI